MGRLVVLILLVVLAVWLVRRALRGSSPPKTLSEGELVRCAHCGVHLPRADAREQAGALYCSAEHARLGKR
jgi:uncharacterized protein